MAMSSSAIGCYGIFCEFCQIQGKNVEINGFCTTCEEYLCAPCCDDHEDNSRTRTHVLQDKQHMPRDTKLSRTKQILIDVCSEHKDNHIEYFCDACDKLLCSACAITKHKTCPNVQYLVDLVTTIDTNPIFVDFNRQSEEVKKSLGGNKASLLEISEAINENYLAAKREIERKRTELIARFQALLQELDQEANKITKCDYDRNKQIQSKLSDIDGKYNKMVNSIERTKGDRRKVQRFIHTLNSREELDELDKATQTIKAQITHKQFTFVAAPEVEQILEHTPRFGALVQDDSLRNAKEIKNIDLKTEKETKSCEVTGVALFSDIGLIAADNNNGTLKFVDLVRDNVVSTVKTPSAPWDVTKIDDTMAATTLPSKDKIQFICVSCTGELTLDKLIDGGYNCCGIEYSTDILYVSYGFPDYCVRLMDTSGIVKKRIYHKLCNRPWYLSVTRDRSTIIVSNGVDNTEKTILLSLTLDGNAQIYASRNYTNIKAGELFTFKARGHTIDPFRGIYVCNGRYVSFKRHKNGRFRDMIDFTKENGGPRSVAFCDKSHRLYVGMRGNCLKIFQITYQTRASRSEHV